MGMALKRKQIRNSKVEVVLKHRRSVVPTVTMQELREPARPVQYRHHHFAAWRLTWISACQLVRPLNCLPRIMQVVKLHGPLRVFSGTEVDWVVRLLAQFFSDESDLGSRREVSVWLGEITWIRARPSL